jgi:UrcA family protein
MNTSTLLRRLAASLPGIATIVALSIATMPAAHADNAVPHVTVQFGDLDLGREQGAATLYARLRAATGTVCSRGAVNADLRGKTAEQLCREQAMARAVQGIEHPAFTAWYAAKTGRIAAGALVAKRN